MQDLHAGVLHTVQKNYVHVWYLLGLARPNKQAAPKLQEYTFHVIQEKDNKNFEGEQQEGKNWGRIG